MSDILLKVKDLVKHFPIMNNSLFSRQVNLVRAVDGISFFLKRGETLGLVGESGCGKSTTGRLILRLIEATAGEITFDGMDVRSLKGEELRAYRKEVQIIFQDPFGSLNPRMTVKQIVAEPMLVHGIADGPTREKRAMELLNVVGLPPSYANRYPHEFSGGQRQRIGVARALAVNPKLIVCDEPVSALDVSIQAQVINLLQDLQKEFNLAYLFISHDLSVVKHISDRVAVMYLGKIVEIAAKDDLYNNPQHPYTEALLSAVPIPDPTQKKKRVILEGDVPSPLKPPSGCRFHPRCRYATEICIRHEPQLAEIAEGHVVACHLRKCGPDKVATG